MNKKWDYKSKMKSTESGMMKSELVSAKYGKGWVDHNIKSTTLKRISNFQTGYTKLEKFRCTEVRSERSIMWNMS